MRVHPSCAALAIAGMTALPAFGDILLVPSEYPTIQAAIDAATNGDEVRVAPGVYELAATIVWDGKAITVRSTDGPEATILDGMDQVGPLIRINGAAGQGGVLEGFTIRRGRVSDATGAAGIKLSGVDLVIRDCEFRENVQTQPGGHWGSGALRSNGANPTIEDCLFEANASTYGPAAIYHMNGGQIEVVNSRFSGNFGWPDPDGNGILHVQRENVATSARIVGCLFDSNTGARGAGVSLWNGATAEIIDTEFRDAEILSDPAPVGTAVEINTAYTPCWATLQNVTVCGYPEPMINPSNWTDLGGNSFELECAPSYGGCCLDGACIHVSNAECTLVGGVFLGEAVDCAAADCSATIVHRGACCIGSLCFTVLADECAANGGTYLGDGASCDANACGPVGTGACCVGGECVQTALEDCFVLGGTFAGVSVGCAAVACEAPCVADLVVDGVVDFVDLVRLLSDWGPCP